ncbi:putative glycolipid-binding domain-containing protein [Roseisolibacter agri]|uniref:Glycolipid-binding protein n=1 Tax=Roseisolibacter agri TaxID=2014610 RepID=A0AA37V0V3_9BACT|nr:putative glycolipid-binding domain-containing protein [Roseisolibacter agri]GLC25195.1 hypothetical protein rosag_17080 [Roseisolibacter agri]
MSASPTLVRTVCWRRLDVPGHESVRLLRTIDGWRLEGSVALRHDGDAVALRHTVDCDAAWRTRAGTVQGRIGARDVELALARDADDRWTLNGVRCPAVDGCVDVDYGFSPSTNLLPIRRLALAVGEAGPVRTAWLRFPELTLEVLSQTYTRTAERTWAFASGGGAFRATLDVDAHGLVTRYGDRWVAEDA